MFGPDDSISEMIFKLLKRLVSDAHSNGLAKHIKPQICTVAFRFCSCRCLPLICFMWIDNQLPFNKFIISFLHSSPLGCVTPVLRFFKILLSFFKIYLFIHFLLSQSGLLDLRLRNAFVLLQGCYTDIQPASRLWEFLLRSAQLPINNCAIWELIREA